MQSRTKMDETLKRAVEAGAVPGVVAAAASDKAPIYEGAFGKRDISGSTAMTFDTVFWIASMTKAITSTAAMQLVEQGKLTLDGPISRVLPELGDPQVLEGFDAQGKPRLRPAKRPITLRHLLTHTAGFGYDIWNADLGRYMELNGIPGIISCSNAALKLPLVFDPGDRWHYGINIDFVGKAVEALSGESLEDYFRAHIFDPLGMKDTGFVLGPSQRQRLAAMHVRGADGSLTPAPFEIPQQPEFFMGGGGLYGTAADYLRFQMMLLNGGALDGARILKPETLAMMAQNQIGDLEVELLKTAIPQSSNDAKFFPGMVEKWGLGFTINTEPGPAGRSPGSLAWAGLGNTYFWVDPARKLAGVILMQILPFADRNALDLYADFERAIYT